MGSYRWALVICITEGIPRSYGNMSYGGTVRRSQLSEPRSSTPNIKTQRLRALYDPLVKPHNPDYTILEFQKIPHLSSKIQDALYRRLL
jgi:hypothetical protein